MWKLRGKYIADLLNGLEGIGIFVDEFDETMISAYVRGDVSERDLLAHVCQFQDLTSYQLWLQQELLPDSQRRRSPTSVEQLVHEISVHLRRKYVQGNPTIVSSSPCIKMAQLC